MSRPGRELEELAYLQLGQHAAALERAAREFGVPLQAMASILVVERIQYNLPDAMAALQRTGQTVLDLLALAGAPIDTGLEWRGLSAWVNCSRSWCRIQWETAFRAWELSGRESSGITEEQLCAHTHSVAQAMRVAALILRTHAAQWRPMYPRVLDSPGVLGTLYNVSDFRNKAPHPNPRVGGSVLDTVVDGELLPGLPFGARVQLAHDSRRMREFIRTVEESQ